VREGVEDLLIPKSTSVKCQKLCTDQRATTNALSKFKSSIQSINANTQLPFDHKLTKSQSTKLYALPHEFYRYQQFTFLFGLWTSEWNSMCNVLKLSRFALNRISPPFSYYMTQSSRCLLKENDQSSTRKGMKIQLKIITTNNIHISEISWRIVRGEFQYKMIN
jgi:hypothetical protein